MRIAFVGKGGSGKTTLCGLFCKFLYNQQEFVVAIDADINQHLVRMLSHDVNHIPQTNPLSPRQDLLKSHLAGNNKRIASPKEVIKSTPPGTGSRLCSEDNYHWLLHNIATDIDGIPLITLGGINAEDVGTRCYHAKTGLVELILNHTKDQEEEYLVVDMTAGADAFASGLFASFDLTILVVEPTAQSLDVWTQYKEHADAYQIPLKAVGNKCMDSTDEAFLAKELGDQLLCTLPYLPTIKQRAQGTTAIISKSDYQEPCKIIKKALDQIPVDWQARLKQIHRLHKKNATSWANAAYQTDLTSQIDPTFSYE
jgi:CO dehydrogenase maturation factor